MNLFEFERDKSRGQLTSRGLEWGNKQTKLKKAIVTGFHKLIKVALNNLARIKHAHLWYSITLILITLRKVLLHKRKQLKPRDNYHTLLCKGDRGFAEMQTKANAMATKISLAFILSDTTAKENAKKCSDL